MLSGIEYPTSAAPTPQALTFEAPPFQRDLAMAKYHHFEVASAAFQIGIVLASATIITGMIALAWISGLLALTGIVFTAIGLFAPHAVHLM